MRCLTDNLFVFNVKTLSGRIGFQAALRRLLGIPNNMEENTDLILDLKLNLN